MVSHCFPLSVTVCTNLHRNRGQNPAEHRSPGPTEVAKWARDRRRKARCRKRLGLAAYGLATRRREVHPTGLEPATFGPGDRRRFRPKPKAGKELRRRGRSRGDSSGALLLAAQGHGLHRPAPKLQDRARLATPQEDMSPSRLFGHLYVARGAVVVLICYYRLPLSSSIDSVGTTCILYVKRSLISGHSMGRGTSLVLFLLV